MAFFNRTNVLPLTGASTSNLQNMSLNRLTVQNGLIKPTYVDTDTFANLKDVTASNNNIGIGDGSISGITNSGVVSIGVNAGLTGSNVGNDSVIIGGTETGAFANSVAQLGCGADNVVIGPSALGGATVFGEEAVVIGAGAGYNGVGSDTIMIGRAAGLGSTANASTKSIFIGDNAAFGTGTFNDSSICIGFAAGIGGSGLYSVAMGVQAKALAQSSIAIGKASEASTGNYTVAVGDSAVALGLESVSMGLSATTTGERCVAIGPITKALGLECVSMGLLATTTGERCVAIGPTTKATGNNSVCIGAGACTTAGSGSSVVAIGKLAGAVNAPGDNAICIGTDAGQGTAATAVGANSICIGNQAGVSGAGQDSILIGQSAQGTSNNSIVINATGAPLSSVASGLVIKPIQGLVAAMTSLENNVQLPTTASGFTQVLCYNPGTGEIRAVTQSTIP